MPAKGRKAAVEEGRTEPERVGTNAPEVAEALRGFVSDTYVLLAKTQAAHWNMRGPNFIGLHKLTEEQYTELFAAVDVLAERVRSIGSLAPNGVREMMDLSSTVRELERAPGTEEAVEILAADNAAMSRRARELAEQAEEQDDPATHDLLAARVDAHDKAAWLLRANLPHGAEARGGA